MLTKNRREYLKNRSSIEDNRVKAEYDYRLLKWLQTMLDSGEDGGIRDINRVLDTLDKDSIRKHLKDENVYDLLKLVERLLNILDFLPLEQTSRGQAIVCKPVGLQRLAATEIEYRKANETDFKRNSMLAHFVGVLKQYYSEQEEVKQLEGYNILQAIDTMKRLGHGAPEEEEIENIKRHFNMANVPLEKEGLK